MKRRLLWTALACCSVAAAAPQPQHQTDMRRLAETAQQAAERHKADIGSLLAKPNVHAQLFSNDSFFGQAAEQAKNIQRQAFEQLLPAGVTPDGADIEGRGIRTFVFVSKSMPENELLALFRQGLDKDVVFVMRGWGSADINDAFAWVADIRNKLGGKEPEIMIHPRAFEVYRITHVPALLHHDTDDKWYMMQGVAGIDYTVEQIRQRRFTRPLSRQWPVGEPSQIDVDRRQWAKIDWKQADTNYAGEIRAIMDGKIELPFATENRRYRYKPAVRIGFDVTNEKGKILLPSGAVVNPLAADPKGRMVMLFIDGRDDWQIRFAEGVLRLYPDAMVVYTKLGDIAGRIHAFPLTAEIRDRMKVETVPSAYIQDGVEFQVRTFKRK